MKKAAALYICYYNITEPLVQTQVVAYLRELGRRGIEVHLLTFEKDRLDSSQQLKIRDDLRREGIRWYWLRYHGRPSLPATIYDIVLGSAKAMLLCVRHGIPLVHGRSHVGAAMACPVKWMRGVKLLFDVRGLLADEYADVGHWTRTSVKYRVTKAMERMLFRQADALILLTEAIKADLVATNPILRHRVEVIPCCVPVEEYAAGIEQRQAERRRRGWAERRVLAYVGKLGTWYLVDEMARFFAVAWRSDARFFFQVLTQSEPSPMRHALNRAGVPEDAFRIERVAPEEVPRVLRACDAGISFIRSCYSKRSSSPTKVAEYLAAGLPVVSTAGIGDCDDMLNGANLGIIVGRLEDEEYRRAIRALMTLLEDPATSQRCRAFAERELSLSRVGGPRYASVYKQLLSSTSKGQVVTSSRD